MGGCLSFASSDVLLSTDPVSDAIASAALGNTSYTGITYFIRVRDMVGLLGPGVKGVNHSKLRSCTPDTIFPDRYLTGRHCCKYLLFNVRRTLSTPLKPNDISHGVTGELHAYFPKLYVFFLSAISRGFS